MTRFFVSLTTDQLGRRRRILLLTLLTFVALC